MKICDKIQTARKRAGLSQVDLADALGISRQSVSKWETGESNPEISKLPELARVLGVSTDWLLSEDEELPGAISPEGERKQNDPKSRSYPEWMDHLPGFLLNLLKRYGWIYGVYMAIGGAIFAAFGFVARAMFRGTVLGSGGNGFMGMGDIFSDINQRAWSGASILTGFAIGLGVFIMLIGIVLAVSLKRWGQKHS